MKNKNLIRRVSLFLGAATLCLSFTACKNGGAGNSGNGLDENEKKHVIAEVENHNANAAVRPSFADTNVFLFANGTSEYTVVIPADASVSVTFAAQELAQYFKQATGFELPMKKENEVENSASGGKYILLGRTNALAASGIMEAGEKVKSDGYKIVRKDESVYICGANDKGTNYGVYEFLWYEVGFEAYSADEVYTDTCETVVLKDFTYTDNPDFGARMMDGILQSDTYTANLYRITNVDEKSAKYDYGQSKDWLYTNNHALPRWIPASKYNTKPVEPAADASEEEKAEYEEKLKNYHPEWFVGGGEAQRCLTAAGIAEETAKNIIERLKINSDAYKVDLSQGDGTTWCGCDNCVAERKLYRTSGYYVRFANKVIQLVEAWRAENQPDRNLIYSMFSYRATSEPPVEKNADGTYKILDESCRPHVKLYVKFAPITYCYYHSFEDPNCAMNTVFNEEVKGWESITDRFMIWDYSANYRKYLFFFYDFETYKDNYALYKRIGVDDMFREYNSGGNLTPFTYLKTYINGKLMWNVDYNVEELIDDFFTNYYKDVAPEVREVFDMIRSNLKTVDEREDENGKKHNLHYTVYSLTNSKPDVFPRRLVDRADELLNRALEKCENMSDKITGEKLYKRVLMERTCIRYLMIDNYNAYGYALNNFESFVRAFQKDVNTLGVTFVSEGGSMSAWINSLLK